MKSLFYALCILLALLMGALLFARNTLPSRHDAIVAAATQPAKALEEEITMLETQLQALIGLASAESDPAAVETLKKRLNALYSLRPENQRDRNPLDQGNDNCPPTVIPGVPYTDTGQTTGQTNDFTSCGANTAPDVIYSYTPIATQQFTISLCGSGYDTRLEVRSGGSCPGTTQNACNDDACGLQSLITITLTTGIQYFIIVDGFSSASGSYTLSVTGPCVPAPHHDMCANAEVASPLPYADSDDNTCAVEECAALSNGAYGDVWYTFTTTETCDLTIDLCGTAPAFANAYIVLTQAGCCSPFTFANNWNNSSCDGNWSINWLGLPAGSWYYPVLKDVGSEGPYTITITCTPPPQTLCDAVIPASCGNLLTAESTSGGTDLVEHYPNCAWDESGRERIYSISLQEGETVTATLLNSSADLDLFLIPVCDFAPLTEVTFGNREVTYTAPSTGTYYLVVDGSHGAQGTFDLMISCSMDLPPSAYDPSLDTHIYYDGTCAGPNTLILSPPDGAIADRCTFINKGMIGDVASINDSAGAWSSGSLQPGEEFELPLVGLGRYPWIAQTPTGAFSGQAIVPGGAVVAPEHLTIQFLQGDLTFRWDSPARTMPDHWRLESAPTPDGPYSVLMDSVLTQEITLPNPVLQPRQFFRVIGVSNNMGYFDAFNGTIQRILSHNDPNGFDVVLRQWHWARSPIPGGRWAISQYIGVNPANPQDTVLQWDYRQQMADSAGWVEVSDFSGATGVADSNGNYKHFVTIPEASVARIASQIDASGNVAMLVTWSGQVSPMVNTFLHVPDMGCACLSPACGRGWGFYCYGGCVGGPACPERPPCDCSTWLGDFCAAFMIKD